MSSCFPKGKTYYSRELTDLLKHAQYISGKLRTEYF